MEEQILELLGGKDYGPSNVPELLRQLRWPPQRQQELQRVLRGLEQSGARPQAFFGGNGRGSDVLWVSDYRLNSSFGAFTPHITLGHGAQPRRVEPMAFEATTIALCHLGRFCACRKVLRTWELGQDRRTMESPLPDS